MAYARRDSTNQIRGVNTDRGYTTHQHLDDLGLIHMNGRVYDPAIGRFMSADPGVPHPENMQSFNRYAYTRNNPLASVDPSGYDDEWWVPQTPVSYYTTDVVPWPTSSSGQTGSFNFTITVGYYSSPMGQPLYWQGTGSVGTGMPAIPQVKFNSANNSVCGLDPQGAPSALLDTGKALWNSAVNTVEGGMNFFGGALPGQPDYLSFADDARAQYDTPAFGETLEFLLPVNAMRAGSGADTDLPQEYVRACSWILA